MPFARIFVPKLGKQQDVNVKSLKDFYSIYSSGGDPSKKVFSMTGSRGENMKCQVLRIADTLHELHEEVSQKRCHVPKLNNTLFEDSDNNDDSLEKNLARYKKKKSENIVRKASARIESAGDILKAHIRATSQSSDSHKKSESPTFTNSKQKKSVQKAEEAVRVDSPDMFTNQDSQDILSYIDIDSVNDQGSSVMIEQDNELARCLIRIDSLEDEVAHWKKLYTDTENAKQFPLTEETGLKILSTLNELGNRSTLAGGTSADNLGQTFGTAADIIDLGNGIKMKKTVHDALMQETEPSKSVINLAHSIWGIDTLAQRCVRKQANVAVEQLEDDKKGILIRHFQNWLKAYNYPDNLIATQLQKLNKYLNSAIISARKKLERSELVNSPSRSIKKLKSRSTHCQKEHLKQKLQETRRHDRSDNSSADEESVKSKQNQTVNDAIQRRYKRIKARYVTSSDSDTTVYVAHDDNSENSKRDVQLRSSKTNLNTIDKSVKQLDIPDRNKDKAIDMLNNNRNAETS